MTRRLELPRAVLRACRELVRGALTYQRTRVTPPEAYQALIQLHCLTGGRSNDLLHAIVRARHPRRALTREDGVLRQGDVDACAEQLRRVGWCRLPSLLPAELCDALEELALEGSCRERRQLPLRPGETSAPPGRFPRGRARGVRYDFDVSTLVQHPAVQRLMADPGLLALGSAYLDCEPVLDLVAMWWTAAASTPDSEAAQLFHFDMDRIKWLKVFVYLTDVDADRGPHVFVAGSHRAGGVPRALLRRGYARLSDEEVLDHFDPADVIRVEGPRGTMFAADTRGLHKGDVVRRGDRLVFQMEYADSLFGGAVSAAKVAAPLDPGFAALARLRPRVLRCFLEGR